MAETGFIRRRLVKSLDDIVMMVYYDGTVRNSLCDLIQSVYTDDEVDDAFVEFQYSRPFGASYKEFETTDPAVFPGASAARVGLDDSSVELRASLYDGRMLPAWSCWRPTPLNVNVKIRHIGVLL
jgi:hypothetical protein